MAIKIYRADGSISELSSIGKEEFDIDFYSLLEENFGVEARNLIARSIEFAELAERADDIGITEWASNGDEARFYDMVREFVKDE